MTRIQTLLIWVFLTSTIQGQTAAPVETTIGDQGAICFFVGAAVPAGAFGNKNFSDSTSGFAKTGLVAGLTASYRLNDMLDLTGTFANFANNVDAQSIEKQSAARYKGYTWTANSDNWDVKSFLGGFSLKQPIKGGEIQIAGHIGVALSTSPEIFLTGSKGSYSNTAKISSSSANAFCFAGNITLKKDLGRSFCFLLSGGFLHTRPQFTDVNTSFTNGAATVSSFYQNISVFTFSAGFGFRFIRKN